MLALAAIFAAGGLSACNASPDETSPPETSGYENSLSFPDGDTAEKHEIIVRFSTDGGSRIEARTLFAGETLDLSDIVSSRPDAGFLGWYLDAALTLPAPGILQPKESLTLYAKWHIAKILVAFETFEGGEIPPLAGISGESIAPPKPPVKEGFVFEGWYEDRAYRTLYVFTVFPPTNLTLYAKWRALQKDVEVRLHLNSPLGGDLTLLLLRDEGTPLCAEEEIEFFRSRIERQSAESEEKISYDFVGWAYAAAGSDLFEGVVPLAPDGIDLYAIWSPGHNPSAGDS